MLNKENLIALRNAIDAVLGDMEDSSPGKRQPKKKLKKWWREEFARIDATGKWKQRKKK